MTKGKKRKRWRISKLIIWGAPRTSTGKMGKGLCSQRRDSAQLSQALKLNRLQNYVGSLVRMQIPNTV